MSEYNIQMNKYNALNAGYDQLYPATKIANVDGLDTALQNKAPAGYGGFGEALPYITAGNDDVDGSKFDALIEAKFATLSNNTTLQLKFDCYPAVSGSVFFGTLWKYSANYGVLTGWSYDGSIIRKVKIGGAWLPFEWVNPPMLLGVEYRTTERHQGMPVYKKLVYFGVLSQDEKLVSVSVANIDKLLRIDAYDIGLEGSSGQTGIIPMVRPGFYINFGGWKTPNNVVLASNSNWSAITNWEAYAILSYTKTTD